MNILNKQEEIVKELTLMQSLKKFYFSSNWYSLLTIPYLFLFLYFAIAYSDNIFTAIGFVFTTFSAPTALMPMSSIVWGAIYEVVLLMPFVISIAMISVLPNIWKNNKWKKDQKIVITIIGFAIAIFLMSIANDLMDGVLKSGALEAFLKVGVSL